jgi:MerR family transcriptional regulator, thiopeptide resistance regulator
MTTRAQWYRTGEFARLTRVSERTLRYYDQLGLLRPARRSDAGYRLYGEAELTRLEQILALKFLGFPLDTIAAFLNAPPVDVRSTLAQQRAMLLAQREQLDAVLAAVDEADRALAASGSVSGDSRTLIDIIRAIQMQQEKQQDWVNQYFTDEQRRQMEEMQQAAYSGEARAKLAARPAWTAEDQARVDAQYAALWDGVKRAVAEGKAPNSPEGQALGAQANALIAAFTQGDPDIAAGLQAFWESHQSLPASQRPFQSPLTEEEAAWLEEAKVT